MTQDSSFQSNLKNGSTILPINEQLSIEVSINRLEAVGTFHSPVFGGSVLSRQDILERLRTAAIQYGIIEANIDAFIENRRYETEIVLAKGDPPVESKDPVIEFIFETDKAKKPKMLDNGSVDFRQLDLFNHVGEGDLLAVLTPGVEGRNGMDVYGRAIRVKPPKRMVLRYGKNVRISEDHCSLYAEKSGRVYIEDEKVVVSDEFEVEEDVSASTGNINFNGSVRIRGSVHTGYMVEAAGSIYVQGVVEGATLIAGDQIVLERGVQGGNKALLKAKGNVVANFIEGSIVEAGGFVTSGAIMHSKVTAKGDIIVNQKKGLVVGGELMSGTVIDIKTAGSELYGTNTLLEVGISPDVLQEYRKLEKDIANKLKEQQKLNQALDLLKKKMNTPEGLPEDKKALLQTITRQAVIGKTEMNKMMDIYGKLKIEIDGYTAGKVKIENIVHPGVKIVISNTAYYVRNSLQYCQFIKDGADIRFIPY